MTTREELLAALRPVIERIARLDPADPAEAEAILATVDVRQVEDVARAAHADGWLTPKEAGGVHYGRLTRATHETSDLSIDAVDMEGPAPGPHSHPTGEFDLNIPLAGHPRFDGRASRWLVYPPGSRHVPTVSGGRMLIFYFLPRGEIRFEPVA